ncbi:peptide deformylase [Staphylococcus schleiferi subsp. coagulans]|uniref:Peptide deformylase-like n=1 Tax=Staphylococcus coagulans TaxID=74706 RepID=A0ABU1EVS9_9STAP|nr:peptide deformylase [Staphylococcus coagulans]MBA8778396.1 peptide deformylase [Staphylococcus coagulans]MDR5602235.1 peptide deformylase [Staphylococcus coagulans]MDR9832607.1 peptide deformylase [Staphylococcus coagulans]UNB45388.1 peptide deformylase [Staphylococcus coagulans]
MIKKIRTNIHPSLRKKSAPVTKFDGHVERVLQDLEDTMYDAGGQALAAPQIGVEEQIALVDMEQDGLLQLINPEVISQSDEKTTELEGCLSVPGRFGEVTRSQMIKVKSFDINGNEVELTAYDDIARMILHVIDNLNGILFVDVMDREISDAELEAYLEDE